MKMKKTSKAGLIGLFLLLMMIGPLTIHSIIQLQSFSRLINYVGIVRGATQRLVKLELAGTDCDDLILQLDGILDELLTGKGPLGLIHPNDAEYNRNLEQLDKSWENLKQNIYRFRQNPSFYEALLKDSETYFNLANDTVFSADRYSSRKTAFLYRLINLMFLGSVLTWIIVFAAYWRRLFNLESSYRQLKDRTDRDPLTGVYNMEKFKAEAQRLLDENTHSHYSVIYVDFADFKYINDVFGYSFGDNILCAYARLNQDSLSDQEVMGRISADNFVILRTYDSKERLMEAQKSVDQAMINSCSQPLSLNCGFCCLEDVIEDLDITGLLDRANYARKTVKNGLKHTYAFYDEGIRSQLRLEKEIESKLPNALDHNEFVVYFQPKVDTCSGKIACAEALVRWRLQDGRIVCPDRFIPVLEKNFQIARLDQYMFESICRWLKSRLDQGLRVLPVSFNVSRLQFYDVHFLDTYIKIRDRYQIPPDLLEIEFTESIAFDNTQLLIKTLYSLRNAGFYVSVDDFGKGYSSLSLLKQVPIDELKLDRLFFMDGDDRMKDRLVVEGIVKMAKSLGIHTVAEGIEKMEQQDFLKEIGCDLIQGYAYYRPMPAAEYEVLLDKGV